MGSIFPGGGLPYRKDGGVPRKLGNFAHLLIVVYAEFFYHNVCCSLLQMILMGISAAPNNVSVTNFTRQGKRNTDNNSKRKRFRLLNFPRAAILDFMTSLHCLCCWKAEVLLFETIGQRSDVMKSTMAARVILLLLNVTFSLSSKICN